MASHAPLYVSLKQPSGFSKGGQATSQRSLLLYKLCWLASHAVVPSKLGFYAAQPASLALLVHVGSPTATLGYPPAALRSMPLDRDVVEHDPHLLGRLTAVIIRGHTELRVRIDEDMSCVFIEMDGTPYPVLLGVTTAGAEHLHTAIATGLAGLASRRRASTGSRALSSADG
ncbi:MAG: hypothetical protein M3460_06970 [Actinomycetota bacterium]|nr:hypothetical protein [Actinomycetota bacterium]